ncbi:MAG: nucleotide exchange factor GrpE [Gemmatimonadaceae bacterium]
MCRDVTPPEDGDNVIDDWKRELRADVERWLATLDEIPELANDDDDVEVPDLYSFHEQLAAATTEARKSNRRTAEAFSQWSETLTGFDAQLRQLREQLARQPVAAHDMVPRAWSLAFVELIDRLRRMAGAFAMVGDAPSARRRAWFGGDRDLRAAWNTQRQAFDILMSHADALVASAGLARVATLHQSFDPRTMTAVATAPDPQWPPSTVIEEIAPGYVLRGELLRVAQVKVSS